MSLININKIKIFENEARVFLNGFCLHELAEYPNILNWDTEILVKILKKRQMQFIFEKIPFWDNFQTINLSYDKEFKKILFGDAISTDQYLILADLFNNYAISILYNQFDQMAANIFDMDFFQPNDYAFINLSNKSITALHHSGYWVKAKCII